MNPGDLPIFSKLGTGKATGSTIPAVLGSGWAGGWFASILKRSNFAGELAIVCTEKDGLQCRLKGELPDVLRLAVSDRAALYRIL